MSAAGARRLLALVSVAIFAPGTAAGQGESVQARLLRTVQIGVPQDIGVEEIDRLAVDGSGDYGTTLLARSAGLVLRRDDSGLVPYDELLDGALNHLVRDGNGFPPPPGLSGFGGKETILAMVYAMAMGGRQDAAVELLGRHRFTGSKYKQGVVLSALRNIGTQRAKGLIQEYAEKGQDRNLAEATLADEDFPVLAELFARWDLVPPSVRTRQHLLAVIRGGCDERAGMAAYWLGFFSRSPDGEQEQAELDALRSMIHAPGPGCGFMDHIIALKSLALRSRETLADWTTRAREGDNVWERHQAVICAFGLWGREFAPPALDLLRTEPAQYVQWELLNGNVETRRGGAYRTRWDVWLPVNALVAVEDDEATASEAMAEADVNQLLAWLESGARPRDPSVGNHMLYHLAEFVRGEDTRRWLRIFAVRPERAQAWWILAPLRDPAALPILRYWSTLPAPKDQAEILHSVIDTLAKTGEPDKTGAVACCQPTEPCLVAQATRPGALPDVTIRSEDQAMTWLAAAAAPESGVTVRFTDASNRAAVVRVANGPEQRWQYLYDCWRRVDGAAGEQAG